MWRPQHLKALGYWRNWQRIGLLIRWFPVRVRGGPRKFGGGVLKNSNLSRWCFLASLGSVGMSIATWVTVGEADPAHAERFAIFIGLWAPTLMGLANYYKE